MIPSKLGYIGLRDPETVCQTFGDATFDQGLSKTVNNAFPTELLLTFMAESINNQDEWRVRSDRFGRCLTQDEIIRVYLYDKDPK